MTSGLLTTPPRPVPWTVDEIDALVRRRRVARPATRVLQRRGQLERLLPAWVLRRASMTPRSRRALVLLRLVLLPPLCRFVDVREQVIHFHDVAFGVVALREHSAAHRRHRIDDVVAPAAKSVGELALTTPVAVGVGGVEEVDSVN